MSSSAIRRPERHGADHRPRKRFGQHFLVDGAIVDEIVREVDPRPGQNIVEIGPGLGALTRPLAQRCGRLTVIELDRDLAARLQRDPALVVIQADVLKVDMATLGDQLRIVGNLPYNVSSPILFHLLPQAEHVFDQHFMLQKEVVDRMAAAPGGKDYGRLSVMLQWRYQIESVLDVAPHAFDPPPRVNSAVVRMIPWPTPRPVSAALLQQLLVAAFSQRRKLLRHGLGRWLDERGFAGRFDLQRRAEEVPVDEYLALAADLGAQDRAVAATPPSAPGSRG